MLGESGLSLNIGVLIMRHYLIKNMIDEILRPYIVFDDKVVKSANQYYIAVVHIEREE